MDRDELLKKLYAGMNLDLETALRKVSGDREGAVLQLGRAEGRFGAAYYLASERAKEGKRNPEEWDGWNDTDHQNAYRKLMNVRRVIFPDTIDVTIG